jgi:hypothetical protein
VIMGLVAMLLHVRGDATMKKLVILAAFAVGTVITHQAVACDYGAHAANATPIAVACVNPNCATDEPPAPQPAAKAEPAAPVKVAEPCSGSGCATDEPAAPKVACTLPNCATDEPPTSAPVTLATGDGNADH